MTAEEAVERLSVPVEKIVEPTNERDLATALHELVASGKKVVPAGAGTKLGWGGRVQAQEVTLLQVRRLNAIADHDPANLTVSVQAGMRYGELQATLREHGQWLPLDSPWGSEATVGGIVAAAASGPRRYGYGAVRDLVLGVRLALGDGSVVHFGGKTVKNVAGYDVTKLLIGSLGTLGVLTEVTFRLRPLPVAERSLLMIFATPEALDHAVGEALRSPDPVVAVEAVGTRGTMFLGEKGLVPTDGGYLLAVRLEGTEPVLTAAVDRLALALQKSGGNLRPIILSAGASLDFWEQYEGALYSDWFSAWAVFRLRGPVRNSVGVLAALEPLETGLCWMGAGTGVGFMKVNRKGQNLPSLLAEVRSALRSLNASVDVLVADAQAWRSLAETGVSGLDIPEWQLRKMNGVKEIFDPGRALAPGRLVGGF